MNCIACHIAIFLLCVFSPIELFAKESTLPDIGISLNVPEHGGIETMKNDIITLKSMGVKQMFISCNWAELEPSPNKYQLNKLIGDINGAKRIGFHAFLNLKIIDTNNRTIPGDLVSQPFDSPIMQMRLKTLLKILTKHLRGQIDVLNLGNEVDIYLASHPSEIYKYASLITTSRKYIRSLYPDLLLGVTTTYSGLNTHAYICRLMNQGMDIVTFTYYPLNVDFSVEPISQIPTDIKKMISFASPRPLILQEVGYPAASELGSSDNKQAQFIDAVIDSARKYRKKIKVLNLFLLYDFSNRQLDIFEKYYHLSDPRFRAYLATLGLKRSDGAPRLSWEHLKEQMGR